MAGGQEKWYFTKEQLQNSASRKCGLDADKELAYRQQAANLIQDMGQRLQVSQLCINTAIVYMHRFYAFHSFTQFHRNAIAAAALFLAAKVEEQPRKLEYVIKVAHVCLHRGEGVSALSTEHYQEQAQDLVFNENVLLQTLGFDVAIDHPHTHVVRTCHLVKAPKDLAQTSYFMASNSLHLTTMCLQYRPTVVACFCIHLASKWSSWAIPQSNEGRHWFSYVDRTVTMDLLERLTSEFLLIFEKCPSRLKRKMMNQQRADTGSPHSSAAHASSQPAAPKHAPAPTDDFDKQFDKEYERERRRLAAPVPGGYVPATAPAPPPPQKIDYNLYREKRDREERERRQQAMQRPGAPVRPRPDARPENPRPESARPENTRPESTRPENVRPESARPENARPESARPEGARPENVRPEARPESARPDVRPETAAVPPHHQRPSQHHHNKPHHQWPPGHHKHHKPPHDHRHHRPPNQPQPTHPNQPNQPQPTQTPEVVPQRTRPPSLFSPENVTTPTVAAAAPRRPAQPQHRPKDIRPPQQTQEPRPVTVSPKKRPDATAAIREMQPPAILSPFSSPPGKEPKQRQRQQCNSEPELQVVVKKLDETPGYENVISESRRGNTTKVKQPEKKEHTSRSLNGIETDPTLVSNLLKESLAKPAPISVPTEKKSPIVEVKKEVEIPPQPEVQNQTEEPEHKHKKEKKKKEKHKHKDRDKSKEERKKHKKDKEREKKKEENPPPVQETAQDGGLRITIPRDKLSASPGLKIKIPKERLAAPPPPPQSSGLKIKISKEVLETSRKRAAGPELGPPQKHPRQNGHPKVGWHPHPQSYRQPLPYFMVQPPPPHMYYNYGMDGYYYPQMYQHHPPPNPHGLPNHHGLQNHHPPNAPPNQHPPNHLTNLHGLPNHHGTLNHHVPRQMAPPPPQPPLPAMPPPPVPPPPPE